MCTATAYTSLVCLSNFTTSEPGIGPSTFFASLLSAAALLAAAVEFAGAAAIAVAAAVAEAGDAVAAAVLSVLRSAVEAPDFTDLSEAFAELSLAVSETVSFAAVLVAAA